MLKKSQLLRYYSLYTLKSTLLNTVSALLLNAVTDLVLLVLRLLREDIQEVVDSMEPVKP